MSAPDFDSDMLKKVMDTYNLDSNFLHAHKKFIEGMIDKLDAPYNNEKKSPEQVHKLRVKVLHTFIKRAYRMGRQDGLKTACLRLSGKITNGFNVER